MNGDNILSLRFSQALTETDLTEELERDEIYAKPRRAKELKKVRTWQRPPYIAYRLGKSCWGGWTTFYEDMGSDYYHGERSLE